MTSYTVLILLLFYQHTVILMRDSTVLRRNGLYHSSKFVVRPRELKFLVKMSFQNDISIIKCF